MLSHEKPLWWPAEPIVCPSCEQPHLGYCETSIPWPAAWTNSDYDTQVAMLLEAPDAE